MTKCWICGKQATTSPYEYNPNAFRDEDFFKGDGSLLFRCYCKECYEKEKARQDEERKLYIKLKKREMFRKACSVLERQGVDMYGYKDAIDAVGEIVEEKPDKFDSSYEVLTAIILVKNRIYSKMQYKIDRYQVDFLIPEMFVVLEIDGERHRYSKGRDSIRDEEIKKRLGKPWEIVRIKTDYLDQKAAILPVAIKRVLDARETGRVNYRELYD